MADEPRPDGVPYFVIEEGAGLFRTLDREEIAEIMREARKEDYHLEASREGGNVSSTETDTGSLLPEQVIDLTDASRFRFVEIKTPAGLIRVNVGLASVGDGLPRVVVEAEPVDSWGSITRTRFDGRVDLKLTREAPDASDAALGLRAAEDFEEDRL